MCRCTNYNDVLKRLIKLDKTKAFVAKGGGKVSHVGGLIVGLRLQVRPAAALEQQDPSRTGSVPLTEENLGRNSANRVKPANNRRIFTWAAIRQRRAT